jgi:sugar lactone lactonase YvrE
MISNNKISNLVATQLPFFVRNDHENFVAFLEAYYEFLEQETGAGNVSRTMLDQTDVDLTDLFIQKFYDNFMPFIPKNTAADKTLILKNIKDFYRSRGSEKSIRFLMRILFDEEVDFYYPQTDILRASAGKWFIEKSIKIRDIQISTLANSSLFVANNDLLVVNNFIGRRVYGSLTNSSAIIESSDTYYDKGSLVRELKISAQVGDFESGEQIQTPFEENGITRTIKANLFSGIITTVSISNSGSDYKIGDSVTIESNTGTGGAIVVSSVSSGNLTSIVAFDGGAGFVRGDEILITGGGGSGANANVATVVANNYFHPNSYNVVFSTISREANTTIGNTLYSNLNSLITDPANNWIGNSMSFFAYANTGPIETVLLYVPGVNYSENPSISATANTRVRNLGILGRMRIINGGQGYRVNDSITFTNVWGGYGTGALGRVRAVNVAASNAVSQVEFVGIPGHPVGGSGYDMFTLPIANVVSTNAQAFGANVVITAVLGQGETLQSVGSTAGAIQQLLILSGGSGYLTAPTLNLTSIGDGTAQATATIITGAFSYPGRYINDDGHLSSYNFIQNRDYYQTFSYVVKLRQSIEKYRQAMKSMIHPAGMKLYGEYLTIDENAELNINVKSLSDQKSTIFTKDYRIANGNLIINLTNHGLSVGNTVYLDWYTGNAANRGIEKGPFRVRTVVNSNNFTVLTTPYLPTQANMVSVYGSTNVRDLKYRPGGYELFVLTATSLREIVLERPYDLSSNLSARALKTPFDNSESNAHGIDFDSNGTFFYVIGTAIRNVQQYRMTENWNVATSSLLTSINLQNISATQFENTPTAISFSLDGKNMYIVGQANDVVFQFNVATPWYVNTANYETRSLVVGDTAPTGMRFSSNGKYMYITGSTGDTIRMFTLGTAWNVNTATFTTVSRNAITAYGSSYTVPQGLDIKEDGNVFYVIDSTTQQILQLPTTVSGNANNIYYEINATGTVNVAKIII